MLLLTLIALVSFYVVYKYLRPSYSPKALRYKHVVITGGSSGIGLALATRCREIGANVTIIARNTEKLKEAAAKLNHISSPTDSWVKILSLDVTQSFSVIESQLLQYIKSAAEVDVLINCAGQGLAKMFLSTEVSEFESLIRINYLSAVYMTKIILPSMLKSENSFKRIAYVSSMAGLVSIYGYSGYSASKFALRGFTDTLRMELESTQVKLIIAYPPDTETPGFKLENEGKPEITKILSEAGGLQSADIVANNIIQSIILGNYVSYFGWIGQLLSWATAGVTPPVSDNDLLGPVLGPIIECIAATPIRVSGMLVSLYWRYIIRREKHKEWQG